MIIWSLRILILAILFPVLIGLVIGLFMWGMLVFLVLSKVPLVGVMFTSGMGLVFGLCILIVIFAFTFGLKLKTWKYSRIFSIILITLILGGFGTIWSLNELSQFEWVENDTNPIEYEYQLNDIDKILLTNTWAQFEIDNSLEEGVFICRIPKLNEKLNISNENKNLLIVNNDYSELNEINQIRDGILKQFDALKAGKLIVSYEDYSNGIIIRVNEKDFDALQNRLNYN
jgi:energy-coupling factor transporter transmembrane protein EcfT